MMLNTIFLIILAYFCSWPLLGTGKLICSCLIICWVKKTIAMIAIVNIVNYENMQSFYVGTIDYSPFTVQCYWLPKWADNAQLFYMQFCHFVRKNIKITPLSKMKQSLSPTWWNQTKMHKWLHYILYMWWKGLDGGLLI